MHTCTDPKRRVYRVAQSLSSRTHTDEISQKSGLSWLYTFDLVQFGSELITENVCQFHILSPTSAFALATQDTIFPMFYISNDQGDYAGRRTDFGDKKSSNFSGEIFRERNYCPRTSFSGSNSCSMLSHPVMSWYGSRVVGCPLGREITDKTCSLFGNKGTPPDFESFVLEKRPWKRLVPDNHPPRSQWSQKWWGMVPTHM